MVRAGKSACATLSPYDPMPEVVLKDYLEEINQLIEQSHLEEAIGHCRHLLSQFPRHVDSYRLLGKALLEKEDLAGAKDVFQRVLSADPEDFLAHAGIAIICKQEDQLREAAWHMERAFEVEPYNVAIREALQDIVGRRDGLPPEKLSLTQAALARLHVRGELYSQAIGDLTEVLAGEPDRIDLQLLLAEALWRDGQRIDAAEHCSRILEKLPNCIKANAILAEVYLATDRAGEAQDYLRHVFEMTLPTAAVVREDTAVGIAFAVEGSPPLPEQIMAQRRTTESRPAASVVDATDWINDIDLGDELIIDDIEPQWLGALQDAADSGEVAAAEMALDEAEADDAEANESDEAVGRDALTEMGSTVDEGTSWFSRPSDQLPGIGELQQETDWESWLEPENEAIETEGQDLERMNLEGEEAGMGEMDERDMNGEEFPEADDPQQPASQEPEAQDDGLDWLDELEEAAGSEEGSAYRELDEDDLPDWLREGVEMGELEGGDLTWLDEAEESPGTAAPGETSEGDALPDWLREEVGLEADEAASDGEDLSWLDQIAAGEGAPLEEPPTMSWPDEASDAMDEADDADEADAFWESESLPYFDEAEEADEPAKDVELSFEATSDFADDDVPEDLEEAMAWLERLAAQQGAPADELPSLSEASEAEALEADSAPSDLGAAMDWLDEMALVEDDESYEPSPFSEEEITGEFSLDEGRDWFSDSETVRDAEVEPAQSMDEADDVQFEAGIGRAEGALEAFDQVEEPLFAEEDTSIAWQDEQPEEGLDDVPEDLDEAMAWLEELAAQQGAPIDELPSMQEAAEPAEEAEMAFEETAAAEPETDEAMAWLEQLAATGEGGAFDFAGDEAAADEATLDALSDIPEDPELALAWLEGLAGDEAQAGPRDEEVEVVEEEKTPPVPHDVVAARAEAEAILMHESQSEGSEQEMEMLEDIPDDPDEAMAWLERLAARQGAPLDELPSITDDEREREALSPEMAEFTPVTDEVEPAEEEAVDEFAEAMAPRDVLTDDPSLLYEMEMSDDELEEGLTDWLALDEEDDESLFDWATPDLADVALEEAEAVEAEAPAEMPEGALEDVGEPAEMSEIALEEVEEPAEMSEIGLEEVEEPEPLFATETEEDAGVVAEELAIPDEPAEIVTSVDEEAVEPSMAAQATPGAGGGKLEEARAALEAGRSEEALPLYQAIVQGGGDLAAVIADLENAPDALQDKPAMLQLLGDAYNHNGQLQKALDAYRQALTLL